MSSKDYLELRNWMKSNPGRPPEERAYFTALDASLRSAGVWPTTTTSTTSTTSTSTTSTTATA